MMRRLASFALLSFLLAACSSCAGVPFRPTSDPDAKAAQEMMSHTVKLEKEVDFELTEDLINKKQLEKPIKGSMKWSGSGFVVDHDYRYGEKGESLIMTAGHVCHAPTEFVYFGMTDDGNIVGGIAKVTASRFRTITFDGRTLETQVVYSTYDPDDRNVPDVCAAKTESLAGVPAKLADEMPPVGAMVQNVGYPLGRQDTYMAHVADGRYTGLTDGWYKEAGVSLPAIGGLSGSGIYYKGKVCMILVSGYRSFEHLTYATQLRYIREAYNKAEVMWRAGL